MTIASRGRRAAQATAFLLALAALPLAAAQPAAGPDGTPEGAGAGGPHGGANVGPVTNLPLPRFVSMRAESANARRGPSLDQRVDWEFVRQGMPLQITAEYGQWRRVRDADGAGGWVHHALLSGARTALVRGAAPVPLRAGPTDAAAVRAMAEPGVIGSLEACRSDWCEIDAAGVEGWLPRAAIWGVTADETIE